MKLERSVHPAIWPQRTLAENWGALGPHLTQHCLGWD